MSFQYREAARLLSAVNQRKGSLKTLAFKGGKEAEGGENNPARQRKRKLYALVSETLRFTPLIDQLAQAADLSGTLFSPELVRDKAQGYVMLYDLLFGKKSIQGGGKLKRHFSSHQPALQQALAQLREEKGLNSEASVQMLLPPRARRHFFPRYARVSLMRISVEGALQELAKSGLHPQVDTVVPSLLVFPVGTELHLSSMVKKGSLILQDKSSCFSAQALLGDGGAEREVFGDVIDACAAPGNKTSHAASLLFQREKMAADGEESGSGAAGVAAAAAAEAGAAKGKGKRGEGKEKRRERTCKVFAFDKDPQRLRTLQRRAKEAGGEGRIVASLQDFLEVDPNSRTYRDVTAILLDPSCSGSGIISTPDRLYDVDEEEEGQQQQQEEEEEERQGGGGGAAAAAAAEGTVDDKRRAKAQARIHSLAQFQLTALRKAMSFPQVKRIVYSTCSIHHEENELVVRAALASQMDSQQQGQGGEEAAGARQPPIEPFQLVPCLPLWGRRGVPTEGLSAAQVRCMVRAKPEEDHTNGFFVALLERSGAVGDTAVGAAAAAAAAAAWPGGGGGGGGLGEGKKRKRKKGGKRPSGGEKKKRKREAQALVKGCMKEDG